MSDVDTGWGESASELFIDLGEAFTPSRAEQMGMMATLVPAEPDEEFTAVDLACGAGHLGAAILRHFPRSRVVALDGSPAMLEEASRTLAVWEGRFEVCFFDLRSEDWLDELPVPRVRCFVSSLAIHHLDGPEKRQLFRRLADHLEPGGALLIADIVEPVNGIAGRAYAGAWDEAVRLQSEALAGDDRAYRRFVDTEWNLFWYPDPDFDKPSKLFEQLEWLRDAGFREVDCFWLRAGHAIYGGYV